MTSFRLWVGIGMRVSRRGRFGPEPEPGAVSLEPEAEGSGS